MDPSDRCSGGEGVETRGPTERTLTARRSGRLQRGDEVRKTCGFVYQTRDWDFWSEFSVTTPFKEIALSQS